MKTLGIELRELGEGHCEMHLPFRHELTQQHEYLHGGVVATIADNSAGCAAFTLMEADSEPLSVEFKINFLAPARGDGLLARARVVKNGRNLKICQSEVFSQQDDSESLCALAVVTMMEIRINNNKNST